MGHGTHEQNPKSKPIQPVTMPSDRMQKWFNYDHPIELCKPIVAEINKAALAVIEKVPHGPERTVALRKLLEAKDAVVRATVVPHG